MLCTTEIPLERVIKKAVTCSPECARDHKNQKRRLRDTERCSHCGRPSSVEERVEFLQWRREKRSKATAERREKAKKEKKAAKLEAPRETPLEAHLGTVAV